MSIDSLSFLPFFSISFIEKHQYDLTGRSMDTCVRKETARGTWHLILRSNYYSASLLFIHSRKSLISLTHYAASFCRGNTTLQTTLGICRTLRCAASHTVATLSAILLRTSSLTVRRDSDPITLLRRSFPNRLQATVLSVTQDTR